MVESINTKVELVEKATSYLGAGTYGQLMVGDKGFEFFNDKNVRDYIQIPWEEVDSVIASVIFGGKTIPRFAIKTKANGTYTFSSKDAKATLRAIRNHMDPNKMVRSLSFWDVVKRSVSNIFHKKNKNK
ncbi:DUF956 family protein [Paucilactobacillus nenjiangensis]|jgi:hypothetical protein|uniref:DUF956 family protein n=1 Tax=Paucilactobacillus nenjiangensis TaxID=1296540 RepID=A0A5P1X034_9LACO|nr:DUF956 family protein [Paucilactobacillus nenjiangensis]QER66863.1 DUF956 family protein [Paucilactobacillus nenjiangensis]